MKSKITSFFTLLIIVTVPVFGNAQGNEAGLKKVFSSLYENYLSNSSKSLEDPAFRSFFAPDFVGSQVEIAIEGEADFKQLDFKTFKEAYEIYRVSSGVGIQFKIKNYNKVVIKGKTGVVNLDMTFEIKKNGNILSKGEYTVSATALLVNDKDWKLTFLNSVYVQSEVFKGACLCELYKQGEESFATFLTVPDGNKYETRTDRFKVTEKGNKVFIEMNSADRYTLDKKKKNVMYGDKEIASQVTQSSTAIANILRFLNAEKCQNVEINN